MVLCTNENIHTKTNNKKKLRTIQFQRTQKKRYYKTLQKKDVPTGKLLRLLIKKKL